MNFDEAKQQVAKDHDKSDWDNLITNADLIDRYYAEAAELYARNLANEKVREDREIICYYLNIKADNVIESSPLPFPETK